MSIVFNAEEIFSIGIQIEKNGRIFYEQAAKQTSDPQVKKLFSELADWEGKHVEVFEDLKKGVPTESQSGEFSDPENMAYQYLSASASDKVFVKEEDIVSIAASASTPQEALEIAIGFEKDSVIYYTTMKHIVRDDLGKDKLDLLIKEEINHIGQLTQELKSLA
ncbi:Rubrerythrin [Chitinispirillum alkaliphilum]|nr:Rubrerythrin [Chitinispirillum alkaliphilum]